eukprot:scaffold26658_cov106-Cyclotella_meneghiniana.AAC.2
MKLKGRLEGEGCASLTKVPAQLIGLRGARTVVVTGYLGYHRRFLKQRHPNQHKSNPMPPT